jgi:hypothetical protein
LTEAQPTQHFVPAVSYASSRTLKHLLTCPAQATISLHISLLPPTCLARAIGASPLRCCADFADDAGTCSPPKASNRHNRLPVSILALGGLGGLGEFDGEHVTPPMVRIS